jgi:hypothetical protein
VITPALLRAVYQVNAEVTPGDDGLPRIFLPLGPALADPGRDAHVPAG